MNPVHVLNDPQPHLGDDLGLELLNWRKGIWEILLFLSLLDSELLQSAR